MSEIFLSHERSTAHQARTVAGALRTLGYGVWLDDELPVHRAYSKVIEEHLRAAKAVVVIWSADAAASDWVRSEANQAREAHKLVQLRVDDARLPMPFDQIQCADMSGWTGDVTWSGWRKVLASIAELTGGPGVGRAETTPPVRKNSICVLPFSNMSGDSEQEYFSDGISEDIITDLSKVSALFVIARNTAFTFKAKSVDVTQVARQLNVSHVLEGSVRRAGGRVRITAQLIDGATGGHVWAERYDRDLTDVFALQDEISESVVKALKLVLLSQEKQQIERRGTNNLEAYDLYLRGTRPAFGPDQWSARIALLAAATRLAPDYADAWGELAKARGFWRFHRPQAEQAEITKAVSAEADRALALDPQNLPALGAQFYIVPRLGGFFDAARLIERMQQIAPNDIDVLSRASDHLASVGRIRDAIDVAQRAYEISPLDHSAANDRAQMLFYGGRFAEARRSLEDLLSRWPDHMFAAQTLLTLYVHTQDWVSVDAFVAPERLARFPLGRWERPLLSFASVMRDPSPQSRGRPIVAARRRLEASGVGQIDELLLAAHAGDIDEAHSIASRCRFELTANTLSLFGPTGLEFRRDPRFVALCARFGLVDYWLTTEKWPDCVDEVAPYYDFKSECAKVAAEPPLTPANEAV